MYVCTDLFRWTAPFWHNSLRIPWAAACRACATCSWRGRGSGGLPSCCIRSTRWSSRTCSRRRRSNSLRAGIKDSTSLATIPPTKLQKNANVLIIRLKRSFLMQIRIKMPGKKKKRTFVIFSDRRFTPPSLEICKCGLEGSLRIFLKLLLWRKKRMSH